MKASELCPPPHLEAADFTGDTEVTIRKIDIHEVGEEKVKKGVIFFEEYARGFVLNRTNLKRIVKQIGDDTDVWVGKKLTLYPSETEYKGETVACIRVREKK